jgi:GWxTD domain-containing protein
MSHLAAWIHTPLAQAIAWTLAHFIWEGAVLAAVLMALLRLHRTAPARRRYALACVILAAMPLAFGITLAVIWARRPVPIAAPLHWWPAATPEGPISAPPPQFSWAAVLDHLPWLVPAWFAGVAFFYARGIAAWAAVRRLRSRGVCVPAPEWQARLDALAARMRLSRTVALLESCFTDTPVLIGYLRPVILLPLGCLTGLSTAQVECILLHELAHVARHDYAVNVLQSLVEGLLFYHPAVWWVSRAVRAERENCCDDRVVELMGDARAYAATLAALEQQRALTPEALLAATGGNLIDRIRRLTVESRGAQPSVAPAFSAALLLVIFAAALTALPVKLPGVRHARVTVPVAGVALAPATPQSGGELPAVYRKWLAEDAAYIITDEERAAFRKLTTGDECEAFIQQFWQRRGAGFREEHYRRIAYANEHFAGRIAGWKTDRGRIYITYGPPDEIDDHSSGGSYRRPPEEGGDVVQTFPFQQWRYRHLEGAGNNVVFEFVDATRSGDFRTSTDPSEKVVALASPYRKWLNEDAAYIITDEERAAFQKLASDEERENFIQQFWLRRDPTPGTEKNEFQEEHYRRLAYANEHFGIPSDRFPGWKTDRGRIYIQYGPPDATNSLNGRAIHWTYRYIEGLGINVTLTFEDTRGNGDFRLTNDPGLPQGELRQDDQSAISVMVADKGQAGSPGTIGVGDVLHVQFVTTVSEANLARLDRETKRAACEALLRKYRPEYPEVQVCSDQVPALDELRGEKANPAAQLAALKAEENTISAQIKASVQSAGEPQISAQRQRLALLESELRDNRNMQAALYDDRTPAAIQRATRVTVGGDGTIALPGAGDFRAAGLTPAELQAAIGPNSTVRIEPASRMVTVLVPLNVRGRFHVYGQVTASRQLVQSFETESSGQPAVAKAMPLPAGRYHLVVVVKETASGAAHNSALDFTVE